MAPWLADLLDAIEHRADRVRCRLFAIHGRGCRGRRDHIGADGYPVPGRWDSRWTPRHLSKAYRHVVAYRLIGHR